MKKLKIYLETSVISHLDQEDAPDKTLDTRELWKDIKADKYNVVISDLTLLEINRCFEPKRSFLLQDIAMIVREEVTRSIETERLSALYVKVGGLPPKSRDDATHIAIATVSNCDIILSWNFRHIVKLRAITAVESVNIREGYNIPRIMSPSMLIDRER
ncbi:hypothetical protein FACS1894216_18630 [Synergistales bacterium]|nr:hypothetical protein FACS1894216_18630 [Synergistales bacterium]